MVFISESLSGLPRHRTERWNFKLDRVNGARSLIG